jgi:putative ABC transport system permease protein
VVNPLRRALVRDLWRLRGQVLAAALVVACGLAAYVTLQGARAALERARDAWYEDGRLGDVFASLRRAPEGLARDIGRIPGVAQVDTRIVADVTLRVPGLAEPATGRMLSLAGPGPAGLNAPLLRAGRLPDGRRDDEVLLSETFARANALHTGDRLGAVLNGRWRELVVVGLALSPEYVYEVAPGTLFPDNRRFGALWMPRAALAAAFDLEGAFNDVSLALEPRTSLPAVLDRLDRLLEPYGGLASHGREDLPSNRFVGDELAEIRTNATIVPSIFVAVAAFLLHTLLMRLVALARGQIGVLKAFGYPNARVGLQFLEFALVVVGLGAALGLGAGALLGHGLVAIYGDYFHFPALDFRLPMPVVAATLGIALVAACTGALSSVARAVRLPPAEAMRPAAPRGYRAGLLERVGATRGVGPAGRMLLRNLARQPWRAGLSVTAIALAVTTVVLGRFAFDAVERLIAIEFGSAARDDITLLLREPRSHAVAHELARLPGVLRVEVFRSVPVRLVAGHRHERVALTGIDADAELRRLVDARARPLALPPRGLVLTRRLGAELGVAPGERVVVELADGTRRKLPVTVAALSDEPLGIGAWMDAAALARLLGEDRTVSGAALAIDRGREQALYAALLRMPAVGGVAIRSAMLASIRDSMNRSFVLMTVVMTAFAAVLVVGVVYNSARIALSERGHELASLRVLGFTTREVGLLLLGEQALLVVAGLGVGLGAGAAACRALLPLFDRELFRLPFALSDATLAYAVIVTLAAAAGSAALVAWRLGRLDLVAALKARE